MDLTDHNKEKVFIPEVVNAGGRGQAQASGQVRGARVGCAVAGISYFLLIALGAVIYVWTIVIAYRSAGILGALLSLIFPVLAQVFWGVKLWMDSGTVMNAYCLALLGYVFLTALVRAGIVLLHRRVVR